MKQKTPAKLSDSTSDTKPATRLNDPTIVGILKAFGHEFVGVPVGNRTEFDVYGEVAATLEKINHNAPVGSRDVLAGIKAARQAIWLFKGGRK